MRLKVFAWYRLEYRINTKEPPQVCTLPMGGGDEISNSTYPSGIVKGLLNDIRRGNNL